MYASYKYCTVFVVTYDARCVTLERCETADICVPRYTKKHIREKRLLRINYFISGPRLFTTLRYNRDNVHLSCGTST